jgi:GT2 family glycosyltransferase
MGSIVTIAVVSWNTRELVRACLGALAADVADGTADVHVVDNASSDGSAEMARSSFPWATVTVADANLGFGAAVNLAVARSRSPWLVAANADAAVTPGALGALLATGERDPRVGIVAPRLILDDGSTQHSVHAFPTLGLTLAYNLGLAGARRAWADRLALEGAWNPERAREIDWAIGAFLLVRRVAFEQAGGFDPGQWMYAEDLDLAWRARSIGWRVRYEPGAVVRHAGAAATSQAAWGAERDERWVRSTYAWMLRRRGPLVTRAYAAMNLAGAAVRGDPRWTRLHLANLRASRATLQRHR